MKAVALVIGVLVGQQMVGIWGGAIVLAIFGGAWFLCWVVDSEIEMRRYDRASREATERLRARAPRPAQEGRLQVL